MQKFVVIPGGSGFHNLNSCEIMILDSAGEIELANGKKIQDIFSKRTERITIKELLYCGIAPQPTFSSEEYPIPSYDRFVKCLKKVVSIFNENVLNR